MMRFSCPRCCTVNPQLKFYKEQRTRNYKDLRISYNHVYARCNECNKIIDNTVELIRRNADASADAYADAKKKQDLTIKKLLNRKK